jgi:hypothetical protein
MSAKTTIWNGAGADGKFSTAGNWSNGVPVTGDTAIFDPATVSGWTAELDQHLVVLARLVLMLGNYELGTAAAYARIGATAVEIGAWERATQPAGFKRVKLDLGTDAAAVVISDTGTNQTEQQFPPVRLLCNNAATTVQLIRGKAGIACESAEETSTLASIQQSWRTSRETDSGLIVGPGVTTLTSITKTGGTAIVSCAATTITHRGGTLETRGSGAVGTIDCQGGTVVSNSTGVVGAAKAATGGFVDFTKSRSARTVTAITLDPGGSVAYDPDVLTVTNKVAPTAGKAVRYQAIAA